MLSVLNQKPDLLYKLGAIDNVSDAILTERLTKVVKNNIDYGTLKLGNTNVVGKENVILFSKIKNDSKLINLKGEFDKLSYADKSKFMMDFKDFDDVFLKFLNINPTENLVNSWKVIRELKRNNKLLYSTGTATDIELAAIHTYTYNGDVVLKSMRNENETIIDAVVFDAYQTKVYGLMNTGMTKLRLTSRLNSGYVIRGRTFKLQDFETLFKSGQTNVPLKGVVSTTTERAVAEHFLPKSGNHLPSPKVKVIMKIKSKKGVYVDDLSEYGVNLVQKYPKEIRQYEVILEEGYFKQIGQPILLKTENKIDWYEIELEELGIPLRVIN